MSQETIRSFVPGFNSCDSDTLWAYASYLDGTQQDCLACSIQMNTANNLCAVSGGDVKRGMETLWWVGFEWCITDWRIHLSPSRKSVMYQSYFSENPLGGTTSQPHELDNKTRRLLIYKDDTCEVTAADDPCYYGSLWMRSSSPMGWYHGRGEW